MIPDHMVIPEPEPEPSCMADRLVQGRLLTHRDVVGGMTTGTTGPVGVTQDVDHDSLDDIQSLDSDDSIIEAAGMRGRPAPMWTTPHPLMPRSHAPQRSSTEPRQVPSPVTPPALRHRGVPTPRNSSRHLPGNNVDIGYSPTSSSWRNASTDRSDMWTFPPRNVPPIRPSQGARSTSRTSSTLAPSSTNRSPNGENESARSRSLRNQWN